MHFRIDDLYREHRGEFRQRAHPLPRNLRADAVGRTLHADTHSTLVHVDFAKDQEVLASRPNEVIQMTGTERPATTQYVDGLKQARFTGGIRAADQREL